VLGGETNVAQCLNRMLKSFSICLIVALWFLSTEVVATASPRDGRANQEPFRVVESLRRPAYRAINKAQKFVDRNQNQDAIRYLDKFLEHKKNLNGNELAQVHHMRAFAYYKDSDFRSAIRAYILVLDEPESIDIALERQALKSVAVMYVGLKDFSLAKDWYLAWIRTGVNADWRSKKEIAVAAAFGNDDETALQFAKSAIVEAIRKSGFLTAEVISAHAYAKNRIEGDGSAGSDFQAYHIAHHLRVIGIDDGFVQSLGLSDDYVGSVTIRYRISDSGKIRDAVVRHRTDEKLAQALLTKMDNYTVEPVLWYGLPINIELTEEITFGKR